MAKSDNLKSRKAVFILLAMNCIVASKGLVKLELDSEPAIFGTNVSLKCTISEVSCCNAFTRKWTKGDNYDLIILNSLSSNTTKYKENLNVTTQTSILTIKNFTEEDINIPYECTYGFDTDRKMLSLNSTYFEYHPSADFPVEIHIDRNLRATANIIFSKVYPFPSCFATHDGTNISYSLLVTTKRNGLFYRSNLQFQYQLKDNCYQNISIQCTVGTTNFTVVNSTIPCSLEIKQSTKEITAITIPTILVIITVIVIVWFWQRRKYRTKQLEIPDGELATKKEQSNLL